jgi:hypothetical protein
MRPRFACFCLIAIAALLLLSACGTGVTHEGPPPCLSTPGGCLTPQFVFATTGVGQILIFPVGQGDALGAPSSISGPAVVGGNIAVSASRELFVADHVLGTLAAWAPGAGNSYSQAVGSPYSPAGLKGLRSHPMEDSFTSWASVEASAGLPLTQQLRSPQFPARPSR